MSKRLYDATVPSTGSSPGDNASSGNGAGASGNSGNGACASGSSGNGTSGSAGNGASVSGGAPALAPDPSPSSQTKVCIHNCDTKLRAIISETAQQAAESCAEHFTGTIVSYQTFIANILGSSRKYIDEEYGEASRSERTLTEHREEAARLGIDMLPKLELERMFVFVKGNDTRRLEEFIETEKRSLRCKCPPPPEVPNSPRFIEVCKHNFMEKMGNVSTTNRKQAVIDCVEQFGGRQKVYTPFLKAIPSSRPSKSLDEHRKEAERYPGLLLPVKLSLEESFCSKKGSQIQNYIKEIIENDTAGFDVSKCLHLSDERVEQYQQENLLKNNIANGRQMASWMKGDSYHENNQDDQAKKSKE